MARLQLRRVCRNSVYFLVVLLLYFVLFPKHVKHSRSLEGGDVDGLLQVDDFWVPQKRSHIANGHGERGKPVTLRPNEHDAREKAYREYGFNQFISDKISLNRSVPDTRPVECKNLWYPKKLLKASVVIIFHNEGWSTLMRTVHSVLNRSPPSMLKEIVLVDDYSNKDHLRQQLEDYVATLKKVRLIRSKERLGLIRARMLGAQNVVGDIVIVLDSHCEVNTGWLPPLLEPITKDQSIVTCPIIDFIDHDTFEYKPMGSYMRGTFNWRFDYKERPLSDKQMTERKSKYTDKVWSPVMAGGLFAISKTFFDKLGQYDPGMEVWGGEQYELSFKIWMCGGKMANIPCSRVGHVYRKNVPYSYPNPNAVVINFRRVAEVWMDDYKEWLYERRPEIQRLSNYGDISDRVALRKQLKCKTFKWYMKNVANDTVRQNYEPLRGRGMVRNPSTNLCLDTKGERPGGEMGLSTCRSYISSQKFQYSYIHEFRNVEDCIDGAHPTPGSKVYLYRCHEMQGNQEFHYTKEKTLIHKISGLCVSIGVYNHDNPILDNCNGKPEQVWEIPLIKRTRKAKVV